MAVLKVEAHSEPNEWPENRRGLIPQCGHIASVTRGPRLTDKEMEMLGKLADPATDWTGQTLDQRIDNAIRLLVVHSLISVSERDNARQRLNKRRQAEARKRVKLPPGH